MKRSGSVESKIQASERDISSALIKIATHVQRGAPIYVKDHLHEPWIEVAFAHFDRHIPILNVRSLIVSRNADGNIDIGVSRLDAPSARHPDLLFATMGHHEAIDRELSRVSDLGRWHAIQGVDSAVRHLIDVEISDRSDEVGPPIALVNITADRVSWISRGECSSPLECQGRLRQPKVANFPAL